jgi:hypothetical protein
LVWTAERSMPSWREDRKRHDLATDLIEWHDALGDLLARSSPFYDLQWTRDNLLKSFFADDDNALAVLSEFADKTVTRHVFDAAQIPSNTLPLLHDCVERVVCDPMFNPEGYRAGEVRGREMPRLIEALLFVAIEKAPGAARFVNGDWSELHIVMPIISRLVLMIGWSPFIMQTFLTLCERAGSAYPIDHFGRQASTALEMLPNAKGSWVGTSLPARIAGVVQRMTDANYPLRPEQAQQLLKVLDALIDLGDRRSAALEQTEAFRSVQIGSSPGTD